MSDHDRLDDLRRRVQKDPASIAFAQLAEEYRRGGRHQDAIDICKAGLKIHPGYVSARVTLGRALLQLGHLDEAQIELDAVLQVAPQNLSAVRSLAEIHQRRGAMPDALLWYRQALSLAPNDPELERTIGALSSSLTQTAPVREESRAHRQVEALEQWLAAVHVSRAERRA